MITMYTNSTRMAISSLAAVAIVAFNAVALDQAYIAAAPRGTVEVGELTLVESTPMAAVTLPEITVVARREAPAEASFAATAELPEVIVVAKRVAYMVAQAGVGEKARAGTQNGSAEGALLK